MKRSPMISNQILMNVTHSNHRQLKPYTPKTIVRSNKNPQKSTGSIQEYFTPIEGTLNKRHLSGSPVDSPIPKQCKTGNGK